MQAIWGYANVSFWPKADIETESKWVFLNGTDNTLRFRGVIVLQNNPPKGIVLSVPSNGGCQCPLMADSRRPTTH